MTAQEIAWVAVTALLVGISILPEGSTECSLEREPDGSWILTDSQGCGYNRGVDPFYVKAKWAQCQAQDGYDQDSSECNVLDLTPNGAGEGGSESTEDDRSDPADHEGE